MKNNRKCEDNKPDSGWCDSLFLVLLLHYSIRYCHRNSTDESQADLHVFDDTSNLQTSRVEGESAVVSPTYCSLNRCDSEDASYSTLAPDCYTAEDTRETYSVADPSNAQNVYCNVDISSHDDDAEYYNAPIAAKYTVSCIHGPWWHRYMAYAKLHYHFRVYLIDLQTTTCPRF